MNSLSQIPSNGKPQAQTQSAYTLRPTPQQQRERAAQRRAQKKAQRERARAMPPKPAPPLPDVPQAHLDSLSALFGKGFVEQAMRKVAAKREAFLSKDQGIRAATTLSDGLMAVDMSQLSKDQKAEVAAYVGEVA